MNNPQTPILVPALERATHAVGLWIDQTFREIGLTQGEAHILAFLAQHAPCSINNVHHSLGHKRSTLTSLLDRLEGSGWLTRQPHPESRRLVQVALTPEGQAVSEKVHRALSQLEERINAHLESADIAAFLWVTHAIEEATHDEPSR